MTGHHFLLSQSGAARTLTIHGAFDAETVFDIRARLEMEPLGADGSLTVDLSETSFMDSSGLGFLVSLRRRSDTEGWSVRLSGANGQVRRLLQRVGWPETLAA